MWVSELTVVGMRGRGEWSLTLWRGMLLMLLQLPLVIMISMSMVVQETTMKTVITVMTLSV